MLPKSVIMSAMECLLYHRKLSSEEEQPFLNGKLLEEVSSIENIYITRFKGETFATIRLYGGLKTFPLDTYSVEDDNTVFKFSTKPMTPLYALDTFNSQWAVKILGDVEVKVRLDKAGIGTATLNGSAEDTMFILYRYLAEKNLSPDDIKDISIVSSAPIFVFQ